MFSLVDNPTVIAAITGAVVGAVLSAYLTNALRSRIERRTKLREARELVAEDVITIIGEHTACLLEYY